MVLYNHSKGIAPNKKEDKIMKYYRSINGKPCEITEQEAKEQERKNKELFESGDFQKMLEIEIILVIEQ